MDGDAERNVEIFIRIFLKCSFLRREGKQLVCEYQIKMAAESACAAVYIGQFQSFCILLHPAASPKFMESAGPVNIISTSYTKAHKLSDTLKLQALSEAMKV
jgi:hypothetical protein